MKKIFYIFLLFVISFILISCSKIVIDITLENENIDPIYITFFTDFLTLPQILN